MSLRYLDYGNPNPFREIFGDKRKIAWPVDVYRVTLPEMSEDDDRLNPFERVILKMLAAGAASDAKELEKETCIPSDFIQCVLLRLQDKSFIDEYHQIVDKKRKDWEDRDEKPPVFVVMLLFQELVTGKILPYLQLVDVDHPLKRKEDEKQRFWTTMDCDNEYRKTVPAKNDVIVALRTMKKRLQAFGDDMRLPSPRQIIVARNPERYYLDCPIAIQKSDGEFRIGDPFGNGFSLVLESAFSRSLERDDKLYGKFKKWKKNSLNGMNRRQNTDQEGPKETEKEPYDNAANWGRYPKLLFNLRPSNRPSEGQYRDIVKIQAALEWALFYVCSRRRYEHAVKRLELTHPSEQPTLLGATAEKLGLEIPRGGLHSVPLGRIGTFRAGKEVGLGTVLPLSLLMAAEDASHPLHAIADEYPDFIIRMLEIARKRNPVAHGKGKARKNDFELPDDEFMRKIISVLLPDVRFADTPTAPPDKELAADILLEARNRIQDEFSPRIYNRLGLNLQNKLVYAERFWSDCQNDDNAMGFVNALYATIQAVFSEIGNTSSQDISDSNFVENATKKAKSAGLGDLPETLRTVKWTAIQDALQGNCQTLGASILAFLLISEKNVLRSIASVQPSFISDVAEIIVRRGHGNEPLPLTRDEVGRLRKQAFSTIKTLMEI